ncbi:ATP-dependent Clp protease adaptor ClpS [Kibdelosporangium aridum]|uniref:ATP-dependent Clp protease adaptor protein ClpS n=1 Tax=Kibdelosporangium aridum TaxID=2030 RepID=A0A1W1ZQA8_KIBAR|nr:ATP-dependent Clp protease adaptor ClpS [Kibdelosporangium aridum]SMC50288.1 ATP-dependent Clp protease adaptor protein ClpS [Kibdelosporangium aridum]
MSSGGWRVLLWDDDVNSVATVAFVLHRVVGLALGTALDLPHEVDSRGVAEVGCYDNLEDAEVTAARMQVFGLHSGVVPA